MGTSKDKTRSGPANAPTPDRKAKGHKRMTDTRIEPAPAAASEETRALETQILEARGEITKLYRILLNSPAVCAGWEQLLTAIRQKTLLAPRLRELIILRIAILNRAPYEFNSHISHARAAGITDAEIEAVRADAISGFGAMDQLVLAYTDAMTRIFRSPTYCSRVSKSRSTRKAWSS
jgi:4-carboxymuconolactone decarboxylase